MRRATTLTTTGFLPFVGRVVIFHAALHVLQLVQHGEHVDELAQGEQVSLGYEVLPALGVAQTPHLAAESIDSCPLSTRRFSKILRAQSGQSSA